MTLSLYWPFTVIYVSFGSLTDIIYNSCVIQICRNINRIKVCMETGRIVILLNLESLYESLYDALNQVWNSWVGLLFPRSVIYLQYILYLLPF